MERQCFGADKLGKECDCQDRFIAATDGQVETDWIDTINSALTAFQSVWKERVLFFLFPPIANCFSFFARPIIYSYTSGIELTSLHLVAKAIEVLSQYLQQDQPVYRATFSPTRAFKNGNLPLAITRPLMAL